MPPKKKPESENNGLYGLVFAVITALLFITLCWYAYIYFVDQNTKQGTVYIKADRSPFKIIPDDPGGMKIEYTDKKVFDKITGEKEKIGKNVKVIEEEEAIDKSEINKYVAEVTPLNKEEYKEAAKTILNPIVQQGKQEGKSTFEVKREKQVETFDDLVAMVNAADSEVVEAEEVIEEEVVKDDSILEMKETFKSLATKVAGAPEFEAKESAKGQPAANANIKSNLIKSDIKVVLKPENLLLSQPETIVDDAKVEYSKDDEGKKKTVITFDRAPKSLKGKSDKVIEAPKTSFTKAVPGFYIQISSHTQLSDLETAWAVFKNKYSDIIGSAGKNVTEAEINGTKFHRLSFGPFSTKQQAADKCSALKDKKKDCLIKYY